MALGDSVKALVIMSKMQGWDPNVIPPGKSLGGREFPAVDISNFNKAPNPRQAGEIGDYCVGNLPEGISDSYPEDHPSVEAPNYAPFNIPDVGKENADRRTSGADPYPGGGWG